MILISGGTGLVGSHLVLELAKKGKHLCLLKRHSSNLQILEKVFSWNGLEYSRFSENITYADGDLLDPCSIHDALGHIEEVYHCAALVSFNPKDRLKIQETNVLGTANLVNACLEKGIKKFCHVSSIASFGEEPNGEAVNEASPRNSEEQHSGYSTSKFLSEMEVWRGITEGLHAVIVNPSIIFGPGSWDKGSCRMFSETAKGMSFYTSGSSGFVDVRDVVTIMVRLMEQNIFSERYCLNSENISFRDVFSEIAQSLGKKPPKWKAKQWMVKVARYLEAFKFFVTGQEPRITKESVRSAFHQGAYSNQKIIDLLDYNFFPVQETIKYISRIYSFVSS